MPDEIEMQELTPRQKVKNNLNFTNGKAINDFSKTRAWDHVRITWSDSDTSNFEATRPLPELKIHKDDTSKELKEEAKLKQETDFGKPKGYTGESSTISGSIVCNSVSQWVKVSIRTPYTMSQDDKSNWPKAAIWAFLQPATLSEVGILNYITDDYPRVGFFNAEIDPAINESEATVYRKYPNASADKKSFTFTETNTDKQAYYGKVDETDPSRIHYKIQVVVRNDWSDAYQSYLIDSEMKKSKPLSKPQRKNTLDYRNNAAYVKIWARNIEVPWGEECAVDILNKNMRTLMDEKDPYFSPFEKYESPQAYRNHTWRRERITRIGKGNKQELVIVGLYPKEIIDLFNGTKKIEDKDVELTVVPWVVISLGFVTLAYMFRKLADGREAKASVATKGAARTNVANILQKSGIIDVLAAYAVTGFGEQGAGEKASPLKKPKLAIKEAMQYDKENKGFGKWQMYAKTKALYAYLVTLLVVKGDANYMDFMLAEIEKAQNAGLGQANTSVSGADGLNYGSTFSDKGWSGTYELFNASVTKSIPAAGFRIPVPWLAWLIFSIDFEAGTKLDAIVSYEESENEHKVVNKRKVKVGVAGKATAGAKFIGQAFWTKLAKGNFTKKTEQGNIETIDKDEFESLEFLKIISNFGTVEASLGITTELNAELAWIFEWFMADKQNEKPDNWFEPIIKWTLSLPLHLQLSLLSFDHDFLNKSEIMALQKYEGTLPGKFNFNLPFVGDVCSSTPTYWTWGDYIYNPNSEYYPANRSSMCFGENLTFYLPNETNAAPEKDGEAQLVVPNGTWDVSGVTFKANTTAGDGVVLKKDTYTSDLEDISKTAFTCKRVLRMDTEIIFAPETPKPSKANKTNYINMMDPDCDARNAIIGAFHSEKGAKLKGIIKPFGYPEKEATNEVTLLVPDISVSKAELVNNKAIFTLDIQNFKAEYIFVQFKDLDVSEAAQYKKRGKEIYKKAVEDGDLGSAWDLFWGSTKKITNEVIKNDFGKDNDDAVTVKGQESTNKEWSYIKISYQNDAFSKGTIELPINKNIMVADDDGETTLQIYPRFSLTPDEKMVICDADTSKSVSIEASQVSTT